MIDFEIVRRAFSNANYSHSQRGSGIYAGKTFVYNFDSNRSIYMLTAIIDDADADLLLEEFDRADAIV